MLNTTKHTGDRAGEELIFLFYFLLFVGKIRIIKRGKRTCITLEFLFFVFVSFSSFVQLKIRKNVFL